MKKLKHDWVLCETEKPKEHKTDAGIVLSPAFKPTKVCKVIMVGPGSDLKPKEKILAHFSAGVAHEEDGKLFILLRDLPSEIIGII